MTETRRRLGTRRTAQPRAAIPPSARHRAPRGHDGSARPTLTSTLLAWSVHAYTALGLVCASLVAVGIVRGDSAGFRSAFGWLLVAMVIDSTDGYLARKFRVQQVLPRFDGRRLDDLTDFLNYTFLPLLIIWRAGLLPAGTEAWLIVPLLASTYGFCQVDIKTADGYFLGFPSLWNVAAFYLYVLKWPGALTLAILLAFALLTLVPSRYLYPSQPGLLNRVAAALGVAWSVCVAFLVLRLPELDTATHAGLASTERLILWLSLGYPLFYLGTSWWVSLRIHASSSASPARAGASSIPADESA
jgi:phosphatidylcholine synthase